MFFGSHSYYSKMADPNKDELARIKFNILTGTSLVFSEGIVILKRLVFANALSTFINNHIIHLKGHATVPLTLE